MISIMGRYGIPVPDQTVESKTILERPNQAGDGDGLEIEVHYGASCFAVNLYDSNMDIDVNPFVVVNNNIQGLDDQSELTPMNALARNSTKYIYINLYSGSLFSIFNSIIDLWINCLHPTKSAKVAPSFLHGSGARRRQGEAKARSGGRSSEESRPI